MDGWKVLTKGELVWQNSRGSRGAGGVQGSSRRACPPPSRMGVTDPPAPAEPSSPGVAPDDTFSGLCEVGRVWGLRSLFLVDRNQGAGRLAPLLRVMWAQSHPQSPPAVLAEFALAAWSEGVACSLM